MPKLTTKLTTYHPNTQLYILEKRQNGKRVYTVLVYNATGQKISELVYDNHGNISYIYYSRNHTLHNEHGPADMCWRCSGAISLIRYYQKGIPHNSNGPAHLSFICESELIRIIYQINGKKHNLYGPADIDWYVAVPYVTIRYYINGQRVKKFEMHTD